MEMMVYFMEMSSIFTAWFHKLANRCDTTTQQTCCLMYHVFDITRFHPMKNHILPIQWEFQDPKMVVR